MWNNWEQIQGVAHPPLIFGWTTALSFSLGSCIVQIQNVRVKIAGTKRLFNFSAEAIVIAHNACLRVRCAIFLVKIKQIPSFVAWSRSWHFWRDSKSNSRCYCRCVLSWRVLFQQREMRISWWLCKNSESHFWLWKVWSLVVCSQSSFYVTRARKDDKNRQNTLFLCLKKDELGTQQTIVP